MKEFAITVQDTVTFITSRFILLAKNKKDAVKALEIKYKDKPWIKVLKVEEMK